MRAAGPAPTPVADGGGAAGELSFVVTQRQRHQQQIDDQVFDPNRDGWDSEAVAEQTQRYWNELAQWWAEGRRAPHPAELPTGLADPFQTTVLLPPDPGTVFQEDRLMVRHWQERPDTQPLDVFRGADGWQAALSSLGEGFAGDATLHVNFKTTDVKLQQDLASTRVHLEIDGPAVSGTLQRQATWECRWQRSADRSLRLQEVRLLDWEEVQLQSTPSTWFADCTLAVMGQDPAFQDQLRFGLDHWLRQIERVHRMDVYSRHGLAVGDVNGDGLDDVYFCQPGGLPNRLFVQNADGTATDRAAEAGVDWLDRTSSALLIDLDNDGAADLVVATSTAILFMQNDGQGRFRLRYQTTLADHDPHSMCAADYDQDGDLDVYVCVEFARSSKSGDATRPAFVYHDANDGGANALLRNEIGSTDDASWRFTDVTDQVGLNADNRRHSLAAAWEDFDNDGDLDLYVANDYGQNCLYQNQDGRFQNVAAPQRVVDYGSGMSVSWGDIDHNGWLDLYIGNMFSSAGNRVTRQSAFQAGADSATREIYRRFAKGNSLFLNDGGEAFEDAGDRAGVEMARWAWASLMVDVNNDSWDDLVVANGYITGEDTDDL